MFGGVILDLVMRCFLLLAPLPPSSFLLGWTLAWTFIVRPYSNDLSNLWVVTPRC